MPSAERTSGQPADAAAANRHAGEVVTRAHTRYVDLPYGAGRAALITLDNGHDHTRPNTFGPDGLRSVNNALDEVAGRDDLVGVALTGKPFILAAGADLDGVAAIQHRDQAWEIARLGHDVFRRLGELPVPSFGFINGVAMGGGLEVALHCTYRTISTGVRAVAFPECFLGLVPGWGGTYLLPNLIGADAAVQVIIENALNQNRTISGRQAYDHGIADAMFEPADFLEESLRWMARVIGGSESVSRPGIDSGQAWDDAVARGRATAAAKVGSGTPAPYRALDLIAAAKDTGRDEGFAAEDETLADLIMSEQLRAGVYAFGLTQRRAKKPAGAPDKSLARPVTKVGVLGAGLMASQLGLLFARRLEVPVVLTDIDQARVDKGVTYVHEEVDKLALKGRLSQEQVNRLKENVTGSVSKEALVDADFVVEAVFEEMTVKHEVLREVEALVPPECILATNTSALSVGEMAAVLDRPERMVGLHFFNPVGVLPLVEIVRAGKTDDACLATAFQVARQLKKNAVLVKDAPAFVVNRVLARFLGEITACVDEGTPIETADAALAPLGLPMSPFTLLELVGPPVALHVADTLHAAFPERFGVSESHRRLVEAGKSGVYVHDSGEQRVDPEVAELFRGGDAPSTAERIRQRALEALAAEIRVMLDEEIVAEPQDIDLCMILGAGWPFHLGGITPYLDRSGIAEKVTGARFLPRGTATLP